MLDEALLRPGRLEVQVEIGLPDEQGRVQILKVGGAWGSSAGGSSACEACDCVAALTHTTCGTLPLFLHLQIHTSKMTTNSFLGRDVDLAELAARTKNFSGAEIEGLVKSATSFALNRQVGA